MRIEAVSVCVGYGDILAHAARQNRGLLDRWVIVTTPDDHETRQVCHYFSIDTIITRELRRDGDFSKGRLVENGLRQLGAESWHLQLDADIVLPNNFRNILDSAWLQPDKVYGCDRIMIRSFDEWEKLQKTGWLGAQSTWHNITSFPRGFEVGARWASPRTGYVPLGFFQLANQSTTEWRGTRQHPYPTRHGDACRTDIQYALQWDRTDRELIPELIVAHLESEPAKNGVNWKGRKTKRFGPHPPWMPAGIANYS